MSYSKSLARSQFISSIQGLLLLAKTCQKLDSFTYGQKEKVLQSTIVFMCSAIEEYQKNIIEDVFFKIRQNHISIGNVPVNTRIYGLISSLSNNFKNYLFDRDGEKKVIQLLSSKKEDIRKLTSDNEVFDMAWISKIIWGDKKYPSIKNLPILYNRLGIPNIFDILNKKGRRDYKMKLDSLLSVRESSAHSSGSNVTLVDVKESFDFANNLVYMLDKELYSHFCKLAGSAVWPANQYLTV